MKMTPLRKKGKGIKKAKARKTKKTARRAPSAKPKLTQASRGAVKETLAVQQLAVEKSKFSTPFTMTAPKATLTELPASYGKDKIVIQVRDPWWIHAYWETTQAALERIKRESGAAFFGARKVLRVYDVSNIIFDGKNAHRFFDIDVGPDATSWYIDTGSPGASWCVDIGLLLSDGRFIMIARSNVVHTPLSGPSSVMDEEWMIPEEMFARLYGMGFGFGKSSPLGKAWQERMRRALFSGILSSPGITSGASPVKKMPKERKFWLVVNTELIVYGATEPDARVYVQGKEIKLRQDGTFSLRYALPDGKQVIGIKAHSADGLEERSVTPVVTKETK
ncbi:MAG: DUF4912 domain-containing protein [Candidatus Omnitrophica bacterium]|nr:DUF4912 domain-containing protein [Candidatus Omnitrophota bacterium]